VRRRHLVVAFAAAIFFVLLVADALFVVSSLRDGFETLGSQIRNGRTAVQRGDLATARSSFETARRTNRELDALMAHPSYVFARLIPFVALDVHALSRLNDAARSISRAGLIGVEAGRALGGTTSAELAEAFYSDGRVQLETIAAANDYLRRARKELLAAQGSLEDAGDPVLDAVQSPLDEAREELAEAVEVTERGETLLSALPALFGSEGPRRYLLAFQSPSQARGTGGVIGLYGVLEAERGTVSLTHVGPFVELLTNLDTSRITSLEQAAAFRRDYERAVRVADDINRSPDFPQVARRLLGIYRRSTGRSLHGVLATDPVALAGLLSATGPIRGAGVEIRLSSDNAAEVLLHDTYIRFSDDPEAQSRFLTSLIRNFYGAFDSASVDGAALASALGAGSSSRHLMMYSRLEDEQAGLRRLGATGEVTSDGTDVQHVFHNNLGDNKVDFYLDRSISTRVTITRGGDALVRTEITVRNDAPRSGERAMTTSYTGNAPAGNNVMDLRVLMPAGAANERWVDSTGRRLRAFGGREAGLPSTWVAVTVPPQATRTVAVAYEIPGATQLLRGGRFSLTLVPQPTVDPDRYSVEVVPPAGFEVRTDRDEALAPRHSAVFRGVLDRSRTIDVVLEPTGS